MLTNYHNELTKTLEGLKPENIFNYDESNLSDDPGKKKLIFKRGVKYPDNVISNAAGDLLPPYVVCRAAHMWDSCERVDQKVLRVVIKNAAHMVHDTIVAIMFGLTQYVLQTGFNQRFFLMPRCHLSSHFTPEVLKLCKENKIDFVCLPPNATHLCQPLDASFFVPVKRYWRAILLDWKKTNLNISSVEKSIFPRLLKRLFSNLADTAKTNAISGFAACSIYPLSKEKLLSKIPKEQ